MPVISERTKTHKKKAFLGYIREGYSITGAAHKAKIGRRTAYTWKNEDQQFASDWDDAWESRGDWYEDRNREAALNLQMPAILNGLRIHGRVSEKIEHTGPGGGAIEVAWSHLAKEAEEP